jgi:hypothetical protein
MAWVRYDDQFHNNPKVTAVIAEDPGAIALHTLANTWTNTQKRKGYIPEHQPGVLLCNHELGRTWSAQLVKRRLWHERGDVGACEACSEEYADLPADLDGYVVHNAKEYRPPDRDRTTPGTPADLSQKRREAGRRGGRAAAKKREQKQQADQAVQADDVSIDSKLPLAGVSKSSKLPSAGVSPVPVPGVASNEATEQLPPEAGADEPRPQMRPTQRSKVITDEYALAEPMCKWPAVNAVVLKAIKAERWSDDQIRDGVLRMAKEGRSVTVDALRYELDGMPPPQGRGSPPGSNFANGSGARARTWTAEEIDAMDLEGKV